MIVDRTTLVPYCLPLVRPVRERRERRGWWVRVEDAHGCWGWGEAACWAGFGGGEAATARDLEGLGRLEGVSLEALPEELGGWTPEARHAVWLAVSDLQARAANCALAQWLEPSAVDLRVPVHAVEPRAGVAAVKLKLRGTTAEEVLGEVRAARARTEAPLRLDANGRWGEGEAWEILAGLEGLGVEFVEQPVAERAALVRVAQESPVPVYADESVGTVADLEALLGVGRVQGVVVKPMFAGGPAAALALAQRARSAGLEVVFTSALETAVGRAGAAHTAAAWQARTGERRAAGLGEAVGRDPWRGCVTTPQDVVVRGPGLGVERARQEVQA